MDSFLTIVLGMKPEMATKHNVEENSMRKTLLSALGLVLALSMCATTAFAAGPGRGCGRNFVDTDGDGVCDNAGSMCIYADADGDGICDTCGTNYGNCLTGNGTAFVDADSDGICDNCGSYHWCGMAGTGSGRNFVDANGDGICDNYGTGQGSGYGRGCQGGRGNGFRGGRGR